VSPTVEGLGVDEGRMQELRVLGPREEEEPVGHPPEAEELVCDDAGIVSDGRIGRGALDQLRMPERDRDRRSELVRSVLEELSLAFEQAPVRFRDPLRLVQSGLAPPGVPDHRDEHRRHERHLGQLVEGLESPADVEPDEGRGGQHDRSENGQRGSDVPHSEPVQQSEAHPDEMERHGLPVREEEHRCKVRDREQHPGDVDPALARGPLRSVNPHRCDTRPPGPW
jgi:hypothetical protein